MLLRKVPVVVQGFTGARHCNREPTRSPPTTVGVGSLLVSILGFVAPMGFGLIPSGYTLADDRLHFGLGILGIMVGLLLPRHAVAAR